MSSNSINTNRRKSVKFNKGLVLFLVSMSLAGIVAFVALSLIVCLDGSRRIIIGALFVALLLAFIGVLVGGRQVLIQLSKLTKKVNALYAVGESSQGESNGSRPAENYSEDFLDLAFSGLQGEIDGIAKRIDSIDRKLAVGTEKGSVSSPIGDNPRLTPAQNGYLASLHQMAANKDILIITDKDSMATISKDPRINGVEAVRILAMEDITSPVTGIAQFDVVVIDIEKVNHSNLSRIIPFSWLGRESTLVLSDGNKSPDLTAFEMLNYGSPMKLALSAGDSNLQSASVMRSLGAEQGNEA